MTEAIRRLDREKTCVDRACHSGGHCDCGHQAARRLQSRGALRQHRPCPDGHWLAGLQRTSHDSRQPADPEKDFPGGHAKEQWFCNPVYGVIWWDQFRISMSGRARDREA
ncbi:hypothetical protein [Novosphingobium sp. 9]|uniref:hypothetical protein n=1 Tax=Novosphingobium sp. 9 TaxID=2025349 RepID=UPI0021B57909|nr:hypothetical protein [Novosphingobium sp. 9]